MRFIPALFQHGNVPALRNYLVINIPALRKEFDNVPALVIMF
jgi:hypothetical protein